MMISLILPFFIFAGEWNPAQVVEEVEKIDQLRGQLARGVSASQTPDLQLFQAVCAPVGKAIQQVAEKQGWIFRQVSHKARNPKHQFQTPLEERVLKSFRDNPDLIFQSLQVKGRPVYFRRIQVEKACLSCHGSKQTRPAFVEKNYPQDKAYDFQIGDLRGLYMVQEKPGP